MALFSRRPKKSDDPTPGGSTPDEAGVADLPDSATDAGGADAPASESVPTVGISVTTYGDPDRPAQLPTETPDTTGDPAPSAPAPAPKPARRTIPGLPDNVMLRDALAALPPNAPAQEVFNVMRQLLQGNIYVRVRGDARALLAKGDQLPMSIATVNDERYALIFSGGEAIQAAVTADGDTATSAVPMPVVPVLRQIVAGPFGGIIIDHASTPASAMIPRALIERALADLDDSIAVKSALVGERTDASIAALVSAMMTSPLWVAARRGDDGQIGIAEVRMGDGTRMLEVFSHPLELHVLGRKDQSVKITAEQLAKALVGEPGLAGVIVNPQGPWMRVTREELAPLIALA